MATGPRCAFITNPATACTSSATERQSLCRTVATRPTSNATSNAVHGWPGDPEEKSEALTRWKVRVTPAHPRRRAPVLGRVRRRELRRLQPQLHRHLGYCASTDYEPPFPRNRYHPRGALQRAVGERHSDFRDSNSERASVRHAVADYGIDAPPLPANPATNRAPGGSTRCSNARVNPKRRPDATD